MSYDSVALILLHKWFLAISSYHWRERRIRVIPTVLFCPILDPLLFHQIHRMDLHKSVLDKKTHRRIIWGRPRINVSYSYHRKVNLQVIWAEWYYSPGTRWPDRKSVPQSKKIAPSNILFYNRKIHQEKFIKYIAFKFNNKCNKIRRKSACVQFCLSACVCVYSRNSFKRKAMRIVLE